jgi:hypothetical protein
MSSLKERIELLEGDLTATPMRIATSHDVPYAVLRYSPTDEWVVRREIRLLTTRLEATGKTVVPISLADLLWESIQKSEGLEAVVQLERDRGYVEAQNQLATYLSDEDWCPLAKLIEEKLDGYDPATTIAFLLRVSSMSPGIYDMSTLLGDMHVRKVRVPTILFYPGSLEGTTNLRFMDLKEREALGHYLVKIYG